MTDGAPKAAAGWYPQPDGSRRFWDGDQWLDVPDPNVGAPHGVDDADPEYQAELERARAEVKAKASADSRRGWIVALIVVALVGGCSYLASRGGSSTTRTDDDYTQTWAKSYSATTCEEWAGSMTADQRRVAAADMLTGARNKGDGGTGLPSTSLIATFQSGVSTACSAAGASSLSISEVGATLYLLERERFRP